MKKCLYLIFFIKFSLICHAQTVESMGNSKIKLINEKSKNFNFLRDSLINVCITKAKLNALEKVYGKEIKSSSTRYSGEFITNNSSNFTKSTTVDVFESVNGVWVKDISPPEITYTKKGKEKWITVKVHGYVAKKPNKTEARELLLKQLSAKPLMEDVQLHSIEYYPNDFIVSIVVLDKRIHTNEANISTEARMIAESNLQESVIMGNYRKAYGWVPNLEFLSMLQGATEHHQLYIFIKEVEAE